MSSFFDRFRKDISGVIWLGSSTLAALALATYNPLDPSLNSSGAGSTVRNFCGYLGSFFADLVYQGFGVGAWIFVLAGIRIGAEGLRGKALEIRRNDLLMFFLLIANVTTLLALMFPTSRLYSGNIPVGGVLGGVLYEVLVKVLNTGGLAILLWGVTVIFILYYSQRPLAEVFALPIRGSKKSLAWIEKKGFEPLWRQMQDLRWKNPTPIQERFVPLNESKALTDVLRPADENEEPQTHLSSAPQKFILTLPDESKDSERSEKGRALQKRVPRRVENWILPKLNLLEAPPSNAFKVDQKLMAKNTQLLEDKLAQFNVNGQVVAVRPGPAVTMFEFKPNADVKISRITELADDLSLALSAESVRIIAPLPGRDVVGIETSNPKRETVFLRDTLEDPTFWDEKTKIPVALGKQANGETRIVDLRKMPHMMVAGTTGSGKSVFVVSLITGLLFKHSPKTLRLILIDPKQVDLAAFYKVPHLLMPPLREAKKAVNALKWAIREMEKRYRSMSKFGARGLESFNEIIGALSKDDVAQHEKRISEIDETAPHESYYCQQLPFILVVVEEFGDLMAVDKQNVEHSVVRLAQMARACGIHLVLAMQSPRKDVVTGLIKTNIPGRISFKVASKMDSRIILDEAGAERLLANGDMLFQAPGVSKPERHHGAWLPEKDIQNVAKFWSDQGEPEFDRAAVKLLEGSGGGFDLEDESSSGDSLDPDQDSMYDEVLAWVGGQKEVSASLLQRRFRLGYPRAARMIEIFEKEGVVGPANGSKPRNVLISKL